MAKEAVLCGEHLDWFKNTDDIRVPLLALMSKLEFRKAIGKEKCEMCNITFRTWGNWRLSKTKPLSLDNFKCYGKGSLYEVELSRINTATSFVSWISHLSCKMPEWDVKGFRNAVKDLVNDGTIKYYGEKIDFLNIPVNKDIL